MASPAQVLANQQNSSKSTGPITPEGKAASSRNATKHGLTARRLLAGEDPEELAALRQHYLDTVRPENPAEEEVVDRLVFATWNLRRFRALHDDVLGKLMEEGEDGEPISLADAFLADCRGKKVLDKLYRYQRELQRIERAAQQEVAQILGMRHQLEEQRAVAEFAAPFGMSNRRLNANAPNHRINETTQSLRGAKPHQPRTEFDETNPNPGPNPAQ